MNKELKNLRLRQVDEVLKRWAVLSKAERPSGGWIRSIRQAMGMTTTHLARRMRITRQGVAELERREVKGTATLASLRKAAKAMDAELVYAVVPHLPLAEALRAQARKRAEEQIGRVAHTMKLEAQDVSKDEIASQLAEIQDRLLRNWSRHIWDEGDLSHRGK